MGDVNASSKAEGARAWRSLLAIRVGGCQPSFMRGLAAPKTIALLLILNQSLDPGVSLISTDFPSRKTVMPVSTPIFRSPIT